MPFPPVPQVSVPPGYKLVPVPGTQEKSKPSISNSAETDRKIFVGGLSPSTQEISLIEYFAAFGPVQDATVIREANKSRGFGFVEFRDGIPPDVLEKKHIIDQRRCGVSRAVQRNNADK
jgi:RNA recognition motif-containing protein